jgi:hypothetical protein
MALSLPSFFAAFVVKQHPKMAHIGALEIIL